jgi:PAS domain S-box-containing protein
MNIYAFTTLLASYICFPLAILIYQKNPKNELNRVFTLSCLILGYLAFVEFGLTHAADVATAYTWLKISSFWPFFMAVYMNFILIFIKNRALQSKLTYFILYTPAVAFSMLGLFTDYVSGAVPSEKYWGWTFSTPENPLIYIMTAVWAFFLTIIPLILVFLYYHRAEDTIEKKRAKYVFLAIFVPVCVISLTQGLFPLANIETPQSSVIASTIEFIIITYGIYRYNIFALTPAIAADDIVTAMSNVLFLVEKDGSILFANCSAETLLQYTENELIGQPLNRIFEEHIWDRTKESGQKSGVSSQECTVITKDGRKIPILLSLSVVRDKNGNDLGMVCVGSDLTDHKKAEEAHKKDLLLKEIHHRVKNNMQIISSLLNLQCQYISDKKYQEMFRESQNRIRSMSLIHEKLYQSQDLEIVNFHEYISSLVNGLIRSYSNPNISVTIDVDDIFLDVDIAVPCGLIINELVSNALKHAFPDRKGEITVEFHDRDGTYTLMVADDGVGMPHTIDYRTTETLGLRLVVMLGEDQLDGEVRLAKKRGTEFCITFRSDKDIT